MALLLEAVLLLCAAVYLLYLWGSRNHDYWRKRGVQGPRPIPFFGTQKDVVLLRDSLVTFFKRIYQQFPNEPFVGLFAGNNQGLLVRDPELIKQILVKDFEFFPDRGIPHDQKGNPLSDHLFIMEGIRWKTLRVKLTPTFTSGKIKRMFPLLMECSRELQSVVHESATRDGSIDFKDVLARYSTDVIGTCAFGVECNSLKDPNAEFRRHGMTVFKVTPRSTLRLALTTMFPKARFVDGLLKNATMEEFFMRVTRENVRFREQTGNKRNDFLDLLIELKNKGQIVDNDVDIIQDPFLKVPVSTSSEEMKFTDNLLAAQAFVFFVAGFETSATTMAFCLLEMAYHPEIQKKLQDEIDTMLKKHGEITYEALMQMPYLEKVVAETLRKYPPLAVLTRRSIKPYQLPGTKVVIEAGTRIYIPAYALHFDPAIYPEPERFDPERFTPEAKASRHPYTYLPFGEGPRICIGMRFGLLQTKLGLVSILSRCTVEPAHNTRYPVRFKKGAFITASEDECHLMIKNRMIDYVL